MTIPITNHQPPITAVMGTRGSPLALAQARQFARQLEAAHPNLVVEERVIRTTGDKNQTSALPAIGGKGVFTLEIEVALLDESIDFAVHSLKDLPPDLPAGLTLGCIPQRESADDVLIVHARHFVGGAMSEGLIPTSTPRIGTSSLRRAAMSLNLWPEAEIVNIRGNVETRLQKLDALGLDAIILARAGINRLQVETSHPMHDLGFGFVSAPGQGALAIECRRDDHRVLDLLQLLEHDATRAEIVAERACMKALSAGCSTPLGARAWFFSADILHMEAVVLSPDGARRIDAQAEMPVENAVELGETVARELLRKGAQELLNS